MSTDRRVIAVDPDGPLGQALGAMLREVTTSWMFAAESGVQAPLESASAELADRVLSGATEHERLEAIWTLIAVAAEWCWTVAVGGSQAMSDRGSSLSPWDLLQVANQAEARKAARALLVTPPPCRSCGEPVGEGALMAPRSFTGTNEEIWWCRGCIALNRENS